MNRIHEKPRTKHSALTDQLRELVQSLRPGDKLPPQDELMRRYHVSDSTVLRSLEDLQRGGWIVRHRGRGTFVADPGQWPAVAVGKIALPTGAGRSHNAQTESQTIILLARHFFAASYLRLCADLLSQQAEAQKFSLVCRVTPPHLADLSVLEAERPLGFVLLGYPMAGLAAELIRRGHRAVVMGTPPAANADAVVPCVCADHDLGGYLAARHLLDGGHRRIAFAYDAQMRFPNEEHPRWVGHRRAVDEAIRKNGAGSIQSTVIDPESLTLWRHDAALAADYFRRPDAPTGIAAWNDSIAIMLLGILHRAGRHVPDDVSVIGFDALPEGIDCIPPLTTVDQHVDWQVQTALRLLARPTPPPPSQTVMVLPELKTRSSCGPPLVSLGKENPLARNEPQTLVS